jgi:glycosyltransferase involved in cell wall biosynthesis
MKSPSKKVLVVATSRKTRGGITSVVKAHEQGEQWVEYSCCWIETHIDRSNLYKLLYFIKSLLIYVVYIPFYQLIHIHFSEPTSAIRKNLYFSIAKLFKKKIILHFHAFSKETTLNGRYKRLYIKLIEGADAIIVLSGYWKNEIEKVLGNSNKIKVIHNPCPTVKTSKKKKKAILFAGKLEKRKGYDDLICAFGRIALKYKDWRLLIAGNGEMEEAKRLIYENKVIGKVDLLGWIKGNEKDAIFQEASIFCLPSYAEGFPMAVLDAWAYGIPVICTIAGGLTDIIRDRENAMIVECGNINQLANRIEIIINDSNLRKKLSLKSYELANTKFNLKNINKQIGNLYKELIG